MGNDKAEKERQNRRRERRQTERKRAEDVKSLESQKKSLEDEKAKVIGWSLGCSTEQLQKQLPLS